MWTCRRATRLISDALDRSLSWFERLCLGLHLLGCAPCCRFVRAVCCIHRALPSAPSDEKLSAEARERIRLALEEASRED